MGDVCSGGEGPVPGIGLVILAAGASTRMGAEKQLLPFRGRSLLRHATEEALASGCRPIVVVLGAHAKRLKQEISELPVRVVVNARWSEGMGTSIRAGIEALTADAGGDEVGAAVLAVCDQPFFSAGIIHELIAATPAFRHALVAASYEGARGTPALFSRSLFPELMALDGHEGARRVIQAHPDETLAIPFPEGALDVDTPEDYARLMNTPTPPGERPDPLAGQPNEAQAAPVAGAAARRAGGATPPLRLFDKPIAEQSAPVDGPVVATPLIHATPAETDPSQAAPASPRRADPVLP